MSGFWETRFSPSLIKIELQFFLMHEHLFYKYFVRRSGGQATNGRNVKLQKHDFFACYLIELWFFFCEDSSSWCASIVWIIYPSVCLSGYKKHKCIYIDTSFSWVVLTIESWYFLWRFIWWMSIYSIDILSVCLLVRLQKYFLVVERFRDYIFFRTFFFNFLFTIYFS